MAEDLPEQRDPLVARNALWYRLWCDGRTQAWIANQYGVNQSVVSRAITQVRDTIPNEDRDAELQRSLETLRRLRAEALEVWDAVATPVTVGKDGSLLYDPEVTGADGKPALVRDHSGRIRAAELVLKTDQLIANRLGLDAAQKLDHQFSQGEQRAAEDLAAEAAARLRGVH